LFALYTIVLRTTQILKSILCYYITLTFTEASGLLKLFEKKCNNCEKDAIGLNESEISVYINKINKHWKLSHNGKNISKRFNFPVYSKTIAFVNAVAWIATQEGHHPMMRIGYGYCEVCYSTTSIDALTENDFICAAKIDYIMKDEAS